MRKTTLTLLVTAALLAACIQLGFGHLETVQLSDSLQFAFFGRRTAMVFPPEK